MIRDGNLPSPGAAERHEPQTISHQPVGLDFQPRVHGGIDRGTTVFVSSMQSNCLQSIDSSS